MKNSWWEPFEIFQNKHQWRTIHCKKPKPLQIGVESQSGVIYFTSVEILFNSLATSRLILETKHHLCSRHLFIQSQQWKHQNNTWNLFEVNVVLVSLLLRFINCSGVSTADFEKVNFSWVRSWSTDFPTWFSS